MQNNSIEYPDWCDLTWLACDKLERVAMFFSGGEGDVPHSVLALGEEMFDVEEKLLTTLPCRSDCQMLKEYPKPEVFIAGTSGAALHRRKKNWDGKPVRSLNGPQKGVPDKDGRVWVPMREGPGAHGGPEWDVQNPRGGGYTNIKPGGRIR